MWSRFLRSARGGGGMLNDWSDRPPPGPRKPWLWSGEFWLGVASALAGCALLVGLGARVFG